MEINKNLLPEIILVNTQLPENLGATARGMLNFKFEKLRLVEPKFPLSNEKIIPVAAGADRVIKKTQVFKKFTDCVKDFNYLIGTSNRIRSIKKNEISLENLGKLIQQKKNKIGIVFGPEQSGLDNETLSLCDFTLKINSNSKFSSLNLSHAVTLVCYNLFKKLAYLGYFFISKFNPILYDIDNSSAIIFVSFDKLDFFLFLKIL